MLTVGVDVGGTKIAAGLIENGKILHSVKVPTDVKHQKAIISSMVEACQQAAGTRKVEAIGVSMAGFIDKDRKMVSFASNLPFVDFPLADTLSEKLHLPVILENDANAAGWAEYRFGAGRGSQNMVTITIGTGLGGAIIVDGKLLRGGFGIGGEIGHLKIVSEGHWCGCGHEGCWERYCSGTALVKSAKAALYVEPPARIAKLMELCGGKKKDLKGIHVTQAAFAGDELSRELYARIGKWLGYGVSCLAAILDPELVVIGGGMSEAADLYWDRAIKTYRRHLPARDHRPELQFKLATAGNKAGMLGVADLAQRAVEGS